MIAIGQGDAARAEQAFTEALESAQTGEKDDGGRLARVTAGLGNAARLDGAYERSLELCEAALAIDRERFGGDHPAVARDLHNCAGVLKLLDRRADALNNYQEALRIKRASLGKNHPDVALTLNSLGLFFSEQGEVAKARQAYDEALAIFTAHGSGNVVVVQQNLDALPTVPSRRAPQVDSTVNDSPQRPPPVHTSSPGKPAQATTSLPKPTSQPGGYMSTPAWP